MIVCILTLLLITYHLFIDFILETEREREGERERLVNLYSGYALNEKRE